MANTIDLDKHFRRDSAARKVAERLLTGEPQTRQQLTEGLTVSITTVNRVVEVLEQAGAKIVRQLDGRQAEFRMVSVGKPKRANEYPALNQEVRFIGAELVGDAVLASFETDSGARFRGVLKSLSKVPPLGRPATVTGVAMKDQGLANVVVLTDGDTKPLRIDNVQNVTES